MPLRDIIDITISRETTPVSRVGFGTPLILAEDDSLAPDRVRTYGDIDEVGEDFDEATDAYRAAQAVFQQDPSPGQVKIGRKEEMETWTEALSAVREVDDDWYGLVALTRDAEDIEALANAIEALRKIYVAGSADEAIKDEQDDTDIASTLLDQTLARSGVFYHGEAADEFPDAALLGKQLPTDPGSTNWAYRTLAGIPSDSLSSAEFAALEDKRANFYVTVAGVNVVLFGTTAEPGTYFDIIRGVDWLEQRIAERIFERLANADKIPYTNAGGAILEQEIKTQLDIAIERGVLAADPAPEINVPDVRDQDFNDRANRIFPGITFEATLAGAINRVRIRGTVTV